MVTRYDLREGPEYNTIQYNTIYSGIADPSRAQDWQRSREGDIGTTGPVASLVPLARLLPVMGWC